MNEEQLQRVLELLGAANSALVVLGKRIPDDDELDTRDLLNEATAEVQEALGILGNA